MNKLNSRRFAAQDGFSLLEILVAFSLLALFLGVLLNVFSGGVRGADIAAQHARAVQVAESLLASVGHDVTLEPKVMNGTTDDIYRWRIDIAPFIPPEPNWKPDITQLQAYQVLVAVNWSNGLNERHFSLNTLRLAPAAEVEQGEQ